MYAGILKTTDHATTLVIVETSDCEAPTYELLIGGRKFFVLDVDFVTLVNQPGTFVQVERRATGEQFFLATLQELSDDACKLAERLQREALDDTERMFMQQGRANLIAAA